jgi:hypothetical protein
MITMGKVVMNRNLITIREATNRIERTENRDLTEIDQIEEATKSNM